MARRLTVFVVTIALGLDVSAAQAQVQRGRELPPKPPRAGAAEGRRNPGLPPNLPPVSFPSAHDLVSRRTAEATVEGPGPLTVEARCEEGQQLLGGGYAVDRPSLGSATPVTVVASYPSTDDTWTVSAYNPDSDPGGPNIGATLRAEAHCFRPPGSPAPIRIVSSAPVVAPLQSALSAPTTIVASCPSGHAAIGGGFRTDIAWDELGDARNTIGAMNSWLFASAPSALDGGLPGAWSVFAAPLAEPVPTTMAYAVCIAHEVTRLTLLECPRFFGPGRTGNRGCGPGPTPQAVSGPVPSVSGQGYDYYEGQVACEADEVAVGGGYRFFASPYIWHQIYRSIGSEGGASWDVGGATGYQSAAYPGYDPSGADRSSAIEGWVLCARPPDVPLLVRITSPADRSAVEAIPREDVAGGNVTLRAVAIDGAGSPRGDVNFEWWIDGQPVATGADTATSLEVPQCRIREHHIEVVGTDPAGNTARDDVTVFAGGVC